MPVFPWPVLLLFYLLPRQTANNATPNTYTNKPQTNFTLTTGINFTVFVSLNFRCTLQTIALKCSRMSSVFVLNFTL